VKNILIVDDCRTTRRLVSYLLKGEDFIITEAENGFDALEKLAANAIDMVLTDLNMPRMDGIELIKSMKEDNSYKEIPVIMLTTEGSEDEILTRMKQKTRYNIRLSARKGIVVRTSHDVERFHNLILLTGERETFGVHSQEYYRRAYEHFAPQGQCELFIAEYDGEPLAAVMVFAFGATAWYFYGASSNQHRNLMAPYAAQWEAMRWARSQGCREYDLWGVPDTDLETLEAEFTSHRDGLWGVYRFKRGFGGQLKRGIGVWDRVYNPIVYTIYRLWMKKSQS